MDQIQLDRLFSMAAKRELEAKEFYTGVAETMSSTAVREIFEQLAREEMGHFELLEKFRLDPSMTMKISAPPSDWKVAESQELPPLSLDMKPADAIGLAMKKEQQAVEFYRSLAASASPDIRDIFENLANMELGHKHKLEIAFVDIGYPEVF